MNFKLLKTTLFSLSLSLLASAAVHAGSEVEIDIHGTISKFVHISADMTAV